MKDAVSWGEMAPCEHLVQIYEDDDAFLDTLEGFVADGFGAGEAVVVIATALHLSLLHRRLLKRDATFANVVSDARRALTARDGNPVLHERQPDPARWVTFPSDVRDGRVVLLPQGAPYPTRVEKLDGHWRVFARPLIVARKHAEARQYAP